MAGNSCWDPDTYLPIPPTGQPVPAPMIRLASTCCWSWSLQYTSITIPTHPGPCAETRWKRSTVSFTPDTEVGDSCEARLLVGYSWYGAAAYRSLYQISYEMPTMCLHRTRFTPYTTRAFSFSAWQVSTFLNCIYGGL